MRLIKKDSAGELVKAPRRRKFFQSADLMQVQENAVGAYNWRLRMGRISHLFKCLMFMLAESHRKYL